MMLLRSLGVILCYSYEHECSAFGNDRIFVVRQEYINFRVSVLYGVLEYIFLFEFSEKLLKFLESSLSGAVRLWLLLSSKAFRLGASMGIGSGGQGGPWPPPWIFKHGTNIVNTGLKVLFFGLFLLFFGLYFS